ncbi:MAG: hypothetical protein ABJM58_11940 [Alteripontixanthobacter sp.]
MASMHKAIAARIDLTDTLAALRIILVSGCGLALVMAGNPLPL